MDNRIFNVNGKGSKLLLKTLELAFVQEGYKPQTVKAWEHHPDHGIILVWCKGKAKNDLPGPMTAEQILPIVESYLESEDAKEVKMEGSDRDADHDGHNTLGWRVYCGAWGHVGDNHYAIVAVKPAYMWHGK